ncbi:hypothetical protein UT300012_35630 [Paraclostridium bifermentans]|jgi:hypothetical protein|uniref:hypothetical protein n=1 Tax=Paraclostridium bifermentans TaxID=1490 RepID=UPI001C1098CA|nr:hypothetical protein [Paraclostridium bifermentans]MBS5954564.1 hypothetical protein [Paraclostridium bifermentans]MBU5289667.1 hypothetical protein [Paraclostridium bifermentans]
MKKHTISILILLIYGTPFVFISMYLDYTQRSMLGYLLMISAYIFLSCTHIFNNNKFIIFLGNIISFALSYSLANIIPSDGWDGYFKPFWHNDFVIFVTILSILIQLFLKILVKKKTKYKETSK